MISKHLHPHLCEASKIVSLLLAVTIQIAAFAQETNKTAASEKPKETTAPTPSASAAESAKPKVEDLETKLKELFKNVSLTGRWASLKDGQLGPEKEDKYDVVSLAKLSGDNWVISAKMNYGGREMVAPIPVQVKWAGDAAIIVVDKLMIPGGGTYSARLLVYERTYSGWWTGQRGGGMLYGVIAPKKE